MMNVPVLRYKGVLAPRYKPNIRRLTSRIPTQVVTVEISSQPLIIILAEQPFIFIPTPRFTRRRMAGQDKNHNWKDMLFFLKKKMCDDF